MRQTFAAAHAQKPRRLLEGAALEAAEAALTGESAIRVMFTASAVKVTPEQCPDLHAKLQIACTTLGVDMPDLFIQQNPIVNAFTGGYLLTACFATGARADVAAVLDEPN